ncbi:hypothetical protein A1O1_02719 [Capronia coronata CBS 617.96]|uniref:MT-A70-domain-containing protein n=1 Tax=Capronia coronata CBS 617.96 TaxID=1182541 RepID=W9YXA7_9EURO|nr:uncharacterized protein A1O1_02719 [Capronia coronata CBS 617.96]EXJ94325.1 hypothetical protein A1O1_02719 [Capronia coronata CBS 617.96]
MPGSVIYSNQARTTILVDIPASIESGQRIPYRLKSAAALDDPYPSTEPRGSKRETALGAIPLHDRTYHESVQKDISSALTEIQDHLRGQGSPSYWCHGRHALLPNSERVLQAMPLAPFRSSPGSTGDLSLLAPVILSTTETQTRFSSIDCLRGVAVCNPSRDRTAVVETGDAGEFLIPAHALFVLASLEGGMAGFHSARQMLLPPPQQFHLIVMDPPWSNRSARRSGVYRTSEHQETDPFPEAMRIVKECLASRGWLAVWITNKVSVRKDVIDAVGLLNLHLHEEWVWIKTTARGVPVTVLDGVWRRPYEILLLFQEDRVCKVPRRRVIAAVPDVHSRKPSLKALLDELLPGEYHALELFARSLTAGWWSWGDEVLKFQHESQWSREV